MSTPAPIILECGHEATPTANTPGYGVDEHGARACFPCCAIKERANMVTYGRATLYISGHGAAMCITDWPGRLRFPILKTRHSRNGGGFGAQRTDVYFRGPDAFIWHGVNRGDMDLTRCKRTDLTEREVMLK